MFSVFKMIELAAKWINLDHVQRCFYADSLKQSSKAKLALIKTSADKRKMLQEAVKKGQLLKEFPIIEKNPDLVIEDQVTTPRDVIKPQQLSQLLVSKVI